MKFRTKIKNNLSQYRNKHNKNTFNLFKIYLFAIADGIGGIPKFSLILINFD